MAAGNIGVPVTELPRDGLDAAVIEVSSYQAADFSGLVRYRRADLAASGASRLARQRGGVSARQAEPAASCAALADRPADARAAVVEVLDLDGWIMRRSIRVPSCPLWPIAISRARTTCPTWRAALAVARSLGVDPAAALRAAEDFPPLPHRQQEIGEVDGVLYVDDSISTTPEATIAALDVYRDRAVTVIIGGHDRGIDYLALVARLTGEPRPGVVLLDASGRRIHDLLGAGILADTMREAVTQAREMTPRGGVILLSPAAPSYGRYRSFIERGEDFARCAGL